MCAKGSFSNLIGLVSDCGGVGGAGKEGGGKGGGGDREEGRGRGGERGRGVKGGREGRGGQCKGSKDVGVSSAIQADKDLSNKYFSLTRLGAVW